MSVEDIEETLNDIEVKRLEAENKVLQAEVKQLKAHVTALKEVCETYIPTDKLDEANNKVIELSVGITEEIGRKLLSKP